jgi:hypothetical protein
MYTSTTVTLLLLLASHFFPKEGAKSYGSKMRCFCRFRLSVYLIAVASCMPAVRVNGQLGIEEFAKFAESDAISQVEEPSDLVPDMLCLSFLSIPQE